MDVYRRGILFIYSLMTKTDQESKGFGKDDSVGWMWGETAIGLAKN